MQECGQRYGPVFKAFEAVVMHKDTVALHLEVMEQCVARLLARLARATAAGGGDGAIVNVAPLMGDLTMDVVGSCVFGVAFNTQEADLGLTAGRQLFTSGEEGAGSLTLPHTPQELVEACHFFFAATKIDKASLWVGVATVLPAPWFDAVSKPVSRIK
ncbi:hypothetical protein HaLaN_03945 [Haematococcus lacustris]|uniref:Uncharacterized protein n=1 Tax=Haematococcus lacustris TaxID=44745 RepID=A0A699YFS3_HAELA|nr:hypothetical protein HaLaN_03945 [Haematococcus lacustris]